MRVAVLDDYQGVALSMADWSAVLERTTDDVFTDHVSDEPRLVERLSPYDAVVLMRERTPMPADVIGQLDRLRLVVTTGIRNAPLDVESARARGIVVPGTGSLSTAPAGLTWALILGLARHLVQEAGNVRDGRWQTTIGRNLAGATLGVVGLGRSGQQVATLGRAFGMDVVAWSANLTAERAEEVGAEAVRSDELLWRTDVVPIHLVLSERTHLLGARELGLMKREALLVNTSRAPIVDTVALVAALDGGPIARAALDVFDEEPLPPDSPLRHHPHLLATPHIGYVTEAVYRRFFGEVVEDLLAFLDGAPVRRVG